MGKPVTGLRLAAALALSLPLLASAAGLGKLTVLSALGQPLNAEIEIISLQAGEEDSLSARLAPIEAYRQANIDFNSALIGVRFAIDKRGGRPVVRMTTAQAVQEPVIDMLLELSWGAGRLVREYTFLLDPPEYKAPQALAPVTPPAVAAPPPAAAAPAKPAPRIEERPIAAPGAVPAAGAKAAGTHEVRKGDTLGKIAAANKPDGVTLQQMLIALYRANRDAFIRDNINLVRAGRILNLPDRDTVASIDTTEARRLIASQNADWNAYRKSLGTAVAATPASSAPGQQAASGRITAQPDAPRPGDAGDQLKLSRADPSAKAGTSARAAREDDKVARSKALKEAESRISELERNVGDLGKLVELKNQQLAQLEKQGAKPAAPAPVAKAPETAKPAAPAPAKPAAEPAKPVPEMPTKAAEPAKPAVEPAKPAPDAKSPAPAKPKPVPAAPPPPAPGVVDEILDNPLALGGLGGIVVLLGGYGAWAWRKKKKAAETFADSVLGGASSLGSASVFSEPSLGAAKSGAAGADTTTTAQAMPAEPESDNVDPIAEADVYMAYGRDAQAEEILKEALAKNPGRSALQLKLLEVYAARKDVRSFEQILMKLKDATGGHGTEWDKAKSLGQGIDPQNPLYGGAVGAAPLDADSTVRMSAVATPSVDFDIGGGGGAGAAALDMALDAGTSNPAAQSAAASVDFDLGGGEPAAAAEQTDFAPTGTLIMDSKEAESASSGGLDFDLGGGDAAPAAESSGGLDFDLNLDLGGETPAVAAESAAPDVDLGSISLDLGTPAEGGAAPDAKWQEVATKLDLAKAYEEMGDKDGARALLQEVANDGDAAQKRQAAQMLAGLG